MCKFAEQNCLLQTLRLIHESPPLSSPSSPLLLLLLRLFLIPILNPAVKIHHWSGHICRRSSVFSNMEREEHFRSVPKHLFTSSVSLCLSPSPSFSPPRLSSPRWRPCAKHADVDIFQFHFQSVEKRHVAASGFFFSLECRHIFFSVVPREWMVGWLDSRPANHHERSIFSFLAMFPVIAALTPRHSRLHRDPCWRGLWNKTVSLLLFIYLFFNRLDGSLLLLTGHICRAPCRVSPGVTWRSLCNAAPAIPAFSSERTELRAQVFAADQSEMKEAVTHVHWGCMMQCYTCKCNVLCFHGHQLCLQKKTKHLKSPTLQIWEKNQYFLCFYGIGVKLWTTDQI